MSDFLQDIVRLVVQQRCSFERGPKGKQEALSNARKAGEDSTERIILDHGGESAWYAFYAANRAKDTQKKFKGKANLRDQLKRLGTEPIETQRTFARLLASAINHSEGEMPTHAAKRLRMDIDNDTPDSVQQSTTTQSTAILPHDEPYAPQQISGQNGSRGGVYVGAPLEVAQKLFDNDFWDSIQRIPIQDESDEFMAEISILFQQDSMRAIFGCQIEIGIVKEKVRTIAFQLFGVTIEEKDGIRSLPCPSGSRVEPDESIKLRGCRRDLSSTFRGDLLEGICLSPIYKSEDKQLRQRTDAVSMSISSRVTEGATIIVYVSEWRASAIKKAFYS